MGEVFGFDKMIAKLEEYANNADEANKVKDEYAEKMKERAQELFAAGTQQRTGSGKSGIEVENEDEVSEVGWSARPGLHGYFHELGFHALDNRRIALGRKKKWRLKRGKGGKGPRQYKGVKATYVPPTPHMRPAFYEYEKEFHREAQNRIAKD